MIDEEAEDGKGETTFNLKSSFLIPRVSHGVIKLSINPFNYCLKFNCCIGLVNIDTAGIASLVELNKNLTSHGVKVSFSN